MFSIDPDIAGGKPLKYGEFEWRCSSDAIEAQTCFSKTAGGMQPQSDEYMYQLFDLTTDPYELENIYPAADDEVKKALAKRLREWYPCKGKACP